VLKFKSIQRTFRIGNTRVGGQPGELPIVLAGNIFYQGMPEVTDHEAGVFDQKPVLRWIETAEKLSEKTGVPHFIDVMAMYSKAMKRYVRFVAERSDSVILIGGTNPDTRIAGLEMVSELGLQKRTILNAISPQISKREIEAISDSKVTTAILIAYNDMDFSPQGRVTILNGFDRQVGLLKIAEMAGIRNVLVDTVVFDVPSVAYAVEAIRLVKNELGYPSGCSPANATYDWKRQQDAMLKDSFAAYNASANTIAQFGGADFLIYGPIKQVRNIIPTCAMNDAVIAYHAIKLLGVKPLTSNHPLYKIF